MGTYCPDCDMRWPNVCDFCIHYCFNGEWYYHEYTNEWAYAYNGEGFCRLDGTYSDPADGCDNFYCFRLMRGVS